MTLRSRKSMAGAILKYNGTGEQLASNFHIFGTNWHIGFLNSAVYRFFEIWKSDFRRHSGLRNTRIMKTWAFHHFHSNRKSLSCTQNSTGIWVEYAIVSLGFPVTRSRYVISQNGTRHRFSTSLSMNRNNVVHCNGILCSCSTKTALDPMFSVRQIRCSNIIQDLSKNMLFQIIYRLTQNYILKLNRHIIDWDFLHLKIFLEQLRKL